jgi:hypothetical protein
MSSSMVRSSVEFLASCSLRMLYSMRHRAVLLTPMSRWSPGGRLHQVAGAAAVHSGRTRL